MEALPDFCLTYSEAKAVNAGSAWRAVTESAKRVYKTDKYKKRGEFGELLLHVLLKQVFKTVPAISKIYYKDSSNDTVKGFDAVHVVAKEDQFQLWLGEAKLYDDGKDGLRSAIQDLHSHTNKNYLRDEFIAIVGKIDSSWPHADKLKKLLNANTSLDEVFSSTCFPVLVSYNSQTTQKATEANDDYEAKIKAEFEDFYQSFVQSGLPGGVSVHLFLIPMNTKQILLGALDKKLKALQ